MKFGLFTHIPWPEGMEPKQVLDHTTEEVVYAEELGFHSAWVAEHHFSRYGLGSSSLVFSASVAAQTKKIRLGTAILVPPLHHPIKLAEDAATLDLVSNGRLDAGFGRGSAGYEYAGYNIDRDESQGRFQETINMVQGWDRANTAKPASRTHRWPSTAPTVASKPSPALTSPEFAAASHVRPACTPDTSIDPATTATATTDVA